MTTLTKIASDVRTPKLKDNSSINKYVIELIRISKMYKFSIKVKSKQKPTLKDDINVKKSIDEQIVKEVKEAESEAKKYTVLDLQDLDAPEINYGQDIAKIRKIEYKVEKPKVQHQELWEKEGFYQEKTTQQKVKVQIWPEHNFYDHFKRRRAFLFC